MQNLTMIVAASENNVIGVETEVDGRIKQKIPWRISEDMAHFVELTVGHPVIMGRKTYESIPEKFRPLPNRTNIVLSTTLPPESMGIDVVQDINEAIELTNNKEAYVMGGGIVYNAFLPLVKRIELTRVHRNYDGNIFLPNIDWSKWELIGESKGVSEKDGIPFSFLSYTRRP